MPPANRDSSSGSNVAENGLLAEDELSPVGAENSGADAPFLLIGDHAGREAPRSLAGLGLREADFARHIACDQGVEGLGVGLAVRLDAAFIRQRYSRLVIDCNRPPGAQDSIVEVSDGTVVPGNLGLGSAARSARRRAIFDPYHAAIAQILDARQGRGLTTILISLHSFTPTFGGAIRPWRLGVLHQGDSPFSAAMLALLRESLDEAAGDNEPYAMDGSDFTVPWHRRGRSIDYLELEIRQDLLAAADQQARMAEWLAGLLRRALPFGRRPV